jgi:hypothetical protein
MKSGKLFKTSVIIGCLLLFLQFACDDTSEQPINNPPSNPTTTDCSTVSATFADANAIIKTSCATTITCHGSGSNRGPGALVTYQQIFNARADIRSAVASGSMPKNSSLTAAQKATITCWIASGAAEN